MVSNLLVLWPSNQVHRLGRIARNGIQREVLIVFAVFSIAIDDRWIESGLSIICASLMVSVARLRGDREIFVDTVYRSTLAKQ